MDIPILKPVSRLHSNEPPVWEWQDDKGACLMPIYQVGFAAVLPKRTPGAIVRFYEEAEFRRDKRIVPSGFEAFSDAGELLERLSVLRRAHNDTDRIFIRLTDTERNFFHFFNEQKKHYYKLKINLPPHTTKTGDITYHVNLVRELSRLFREKVYFPEGSEVPGILATLSEMPKKPLTDLDYPQAAAVAYAIAAAYIRPTIEPEAIKKPKPWRPFAALDDDGTQGGWKPWSTLDD